MKMSTGVQLVASHFVAKSFRLAHSSQFPGFTDNDILVLADFLVMNDGTVFRKASRLADCHSVMFMVLILFTQTERMGTSASGLPVLDLVFHLPKDLLVAMPMWSIPSGPHPCGTWGTLCTSFIAVYRQ